MADEKLKLQTNVPETIALEFDKGLPVSGTYGDQVLFTLTDGRRWYAPPFVAAKVEAAGIPAGVFFTICKREIVEGNRRRVEYQIGDAVPQVHPVAVAAAAPAPAAARVNGTAAAVTAAGDSRVNSASKSNLTLSSSPTAAPAPPAAAAPLASSVALMAMAGCGAIDAVLEIEQHAQNRGLTDFAFGPENIQKIAVTLFMEMSRRSGRAA